MSENEGKETVRCSDERKEERKLEGVGEKATKSSELEH